MGTLLRTGVQFPPSPPRRGKPFGLPHIFAKNTASLYRLPLLFRKRSRSRRLFGCKRPHNAFGSLPTFLRLCLRHEYLYGSALSCRNGLRSIPIFLCRKISHMLRHSSFFAKGHIRVGYSVASALITTLAHYQPFAIMFAARISLWFGTTRR